MINRPPTSVGVKLMLPLTGGLPVAQTVKNFLFICLLLAGCQSKNKQQSTDQQADVTINGEEYTDSVSVDSAGNHVRVKPGTDGAKVTVSGSGNDVQIK